MLYAMFAGSFPMKLEEDGTYFIDRDGQHFRYILNYLRDGVETVLPFTSAGQLLQRELLREAEYFRLDELIRLIKDPTARCDYCQKRITRSQHKTVCSSAPKTHSWSQDDEADKHCCIFCSYRPEVWYTDNTKCPAHPHATIFDIVTHDK